MPLCSTIFFYAPPFISPHCFQSLRASVPFALWRQHLFCLQLFFVFVWFYLFGSSFDVPCALIKWKITLVPSLRAVPSAVSSFVDEHVKKAKTTLIAMYHGLWIQPTQFSSSKPTNICRQPHYHLYVIFRNIMNIQWIWNIGCLILRVVLWHMQEWVCIKQRQRRAF